MSSHARTFLDSVCEAMLHNVDSCGVLPDAQQWKRLADMNRLRPLLYLLSRKSGKGESQSGSSGQNGNSGHGWSALQDAYFSHTIANARHLKTGLALADAFEKKGIPTLCYRGPFNGLACYGDLATRPFQDIDLIVPEDRADEAYEISRAEGFESQQGNIPPGFFRRHHIHWALRKHDTLLDLHWRVEHPYTLYKIDHALLFEHARFVTRQGHTWREPSPTHLFLLCAMQITKTEPKAFEMARDENAESLLFQQVLFWKWLDLAVLWRQSQDSAEPQIDLEELVETASSWRALGSIAAAFAGLERFFNLEVPSRFKQMLHEAGAWEDAPVPFEVERDAPSWLGQLSMRRGGFRFKRVRDMGAYLIPPADYFPAKHRAFARLRHFVHACGTLAFVFADGVWTLGIRPVFKKKRLESKRISREIHA